LKRNHARESEVWLVFAKRHTGKASFRYSEAVEEALCFGWIDTTVKRLDDEHYMQRFTPRSNLRNWSNINLERFRCMVAQGRMTDAGRAKLPADVAPPPRRHQSDDPIPAFIARGIASDPVAQKKFSALPASYRRDYVRYVSEAKQQETRERRLKEAIRRLKANWKRVYDPSSAKS
jgi:uncharacterized protein YdeI (YjbR/CyaY-like superfamily)